MSDKIHRNLKAWINRQVYTVRKEGTCVGFRLFHVGASSKLGAEIARINISDVLRDEKELEDKHLESIADDLLSEATNYAEGIGDTQTFSVTAHFEDDEDKPRARHAFRVRAETLEEDDTVSTEPSNLSGIVKMQMRHNEAILKIALGGIGAAQGTLQKQNERLSKMVEKLWDDRVATIETVEELSTAAHQRKIETMKEEQRLKVQSQVADNVTALLPAVANKIVGKKILPETKDISLLQLMTLAEAITPEEFDAIYRILGPEKRIAFVELFKSVQVRREEEAAAAQATKNNSEGAS